MTPATIRNVPVTGITDDTDEALFEALTEKYGVDGILMSLSAFCGDRALQPHRTASNAKEWATMEGRLGVLAIEATQL